MQPNDERVSHLALLTWIDHVMVYSQPLDADYRLELSAALLLAKDVLLLR